jgi:1,2-diacylglycerol 3-beta-galactosyltransferase
MRDIARRLPDTPLILICGRNDALARRLRSERSRAPRVVLGFTEDVPFYMRLADFFIGKPGPGSISEAVAMGLPVIVERNARTIPQERYNADWVLEREVGVVLRNFRGIRGAVDQVLSSLGGLRANVARIQNRAVFEIPEILAGVLERG